MSKITRAKSNEKKQYSLRIDEELFLKIKVISALEYRAINSQLELFVKKAIEDYEKAYGIIKVDE